MSLSSDMSMSIYSLSRHIAKPHVSCMAFTSKKMFFRNRPSNLRIVATGREIVVPLKIYELRKRKVISIFKKYKRLAANVRAWRRGDIPCYVSRDMLLIKDMKMKIYSTAGPYSSVGYVAEKCYIDQDIFVKPP
jgi:hypothetical protein